MDESSLLSLPSTQYHRFIPSSVLYPRPAAPVVPHSHAPNSTNFSPTGGDCSLLSSFLPNQIGCSLLQLLPFSQQIFTPFTTAATHTKSHPPIDHPIPFHPILRPPASSIQPLRITLSIRILEIDGLIRTIGEGEHPFLFPLKTSADQ
jgi:hypothetical protein